MLTCLLIENHNPRVKRLNISSICFFKKIIFIYKYFEIKIYIIYISITNSNKPCSASLPSASSFCILQPRSETAVCNAICTLQLYSLAVLLLFFFFKKKSFSWIWEVRGRAYLVFVYTNMYIEEGGQYAYSCLFWFLFHFKLLHHDVLIFSLSLFMFLLIPFLF